MNYDDFVRGAGQVLAKTGDGDFKMVSMPNDIGVDSTIKVLEEGRFLGGQGKEYKELIEGGGDLVNVKGMDWDEKNKLKHKAGELSGSDETGFMHQEKGEKFKKALNRYKKLFGKASKTLPMLGILDIFNMKKEYDQIMAGEHPSGITSTAEKEAAKVYADGGIISLAEGGEVKKTWKEKRAERKQRNIRREAEKRRSEGDTSKYVQEYFGGEFGTDNRVAQAEKQKQADTLRQDILNRAKVGNISAADFKNGRQKLNMSPDEYHNFMRGITTDYPDKYAEMFPKSAGIPQLLSKVFSNFPGINMAQNIMRSIQGSDLGTMTGDIKNLITGNKATNPDAVSIVDNDWSEVSGDAYNQVFKKDPKTIESIMQDNTLSSFDKQIAIDQLSGYNDATQYEWEKMGLGSGLDTESGFPEGLSGLLQENPELSLNDILQGTGGFRGDETFSETIEDVPAAYAQFPDQGNTGFPWKMSESGHQLDPALNPGLDLSSYGDPGIESWTPAKEQKLNALLAQLMQGYDNGVGSLTEPNIDALKAQIMGNPVTPNFGDLSELYGINANTFNPEAYIQEQMALGNPPNINTGLFNRGGIASLQYGGQPGPFSDPTTVTDEETYDIQPLQMDPGIMGIGDLEDLFEEAKVKESIYDKLKYVNNTMHG